VPVYSHSRLGVYETCPRQYHFQYVERVPMPEVTTAEMFVGSHVHAALEELYAGVRQREIPETTTVARVKSSSPPTIGVTTRSIVTARCRWSAW